MNPAALPPFAREHPNGTVLHVLAAPRSSANGVGPVVDDMLRVRVTASAVDGAANDAIVKLLSAILDVPKSRVRILAGQTAKRKRILIEGLEPGDAVRRLSAAIEQSKGATAP